MTELEALGRLALASVGEAVGTDRLLEFARLGANIVIASRKPEHLDEGAQRIEAIGGTVSAVAVDEAGCGWATVDMLPLLLESLQKDSRVMGDIRGKGLLMAIEIVADRQTKAILPAQSMAIQRIVALGMERGLLLYSRRTANGLFGEWLMVAPPLIVDAQQIDTIAALIGETLQAFEAQL